MIDLLSCSVRSRRRKRLPHPIPEHQEWTGSSSGWHWEVRNPGEQRLGDVGIALTLHHSKVLCAGCKGISSDLTKPTLVNLADKAICLGWGRRASAVSELTWDIPKIYHISSHDVLGISHDILGIFHVLGISHVLGM